MFTPPSPSLPFCLQNPFGAPATAAAPANDPYGIQPPPPWLPRALICPAKTRTLRGLYACPRACGGAGQHASALVSSARLHARVHTLSPVHGVAQSARACVLVCLVRGRGLDGYCRCCFLGLAHRPRASQQTYVHTQAALLRSPHAHACIGHPLLLECLRSLFGAPTG